MGELWLAFTLGNAAILTNACLLPLYPGLIAFLAGNSQAAETSKAPAFLGVLVLAGILSMMTLIGFLLAMLSLSFGAILPLLLPLVYLVVIGLGLLLLTGRNPFATLQTLQAPIFRNPYLTAYVYGLLFGPMTLPCTGPIILSAFTVGTGTGAVVDGLVYFFFFGLGFGWPLVLLPLIALPLQRRIVSWLAHYHEVLNHASGILLIAVGLFGILTELLPQIWVDFYLDQTGQLLYWLLVAVLTAISAYRLYRLEKKRVSAQDSA